MIPICGRCGKVLVAGDLLLYAPGRLVRHYVLCTRWPADWRERLAA